MCSTMHVLLSVLLVSSCLHRTKPFNWIEKVTVSWFNCPLWYLNGVTLLPLHLWGVKPCPLWYLNGVTPLPLHLWVVKPCPLSVTPFLFLAPYFLTFLSLSLFLCLSVSVSVSVSISCSLFLCLSFSVSLSLSLSLCLSFRGFYWHGKHIITLSKQVK